MEQNISCLTDLVTDVFIEYCLRYFLGFILNACKPKNAYTEFSREGAHGTVPLLSIKVTIVL
jgi:hypothetical protein